MFFVCLFYICFVFVCLFFWLIFWFIYFYNFFIHFSGGGGGGMGDTDFVASGLKNCLSKVELSENELSRMGLVL